MGQGVLEGVDAIFGVHMANQATARIGVSMRTVADEDWGVLGSRATDIVEETCAAYGATATFEWADGYPVIVNDDDVAQIGYDAAV
ncbi:hypothetical protein ACIP1V_08250 [Kocuria marina]|uniref:hypothetical protein n=1 Tax=Kocuria marina TaxID=223184 RepID=UPI0037FA8F1A